MVRHNAVDACIINKVKRVGGIPKDGSLPGDETFQEVVKEQEEPALYMFSLGCKDRPSCGRQR